MSIEKVIIRSNQDLKRSLQHVDDYEHQLTSICEKVLTNIEHRTYDHDTIAFLLDNELFTLSLDVLLNKLVWYAEDLKLIEKVLRRKTGPVLTDTCPVKLAIQRKNSVILKTLLNCPVLNFTEVIERDLSSYIKELGAELDLSTLQVFVEFLLTNLPKEELVDSVNICRLVTLLATIPDGKDTLVCLLDQYKGAVREDVGNFRIHYRNYWLGTNNIIGHLIYLKQLEVAKFLIEEYNVFHRPHQLSLIKVMLE